MASRFKRRNLLLEQLEPRFVFESDAPNFLFEWNVDVSESKSGTESSETRIWEYRSIGEGDSFAIDSGRHVRESEYYEASPGFPVIGSPTGYSEFKLTGDSLATSSRIQLEFDHTKRFSTDVEKAVYQSTDQLFVNLWVYIKSPLTATVSGRASGTRSRVFDRGAQGEAALIVDPRFELPIGDSEHVISNPYPIGPQIKTYRGEEYRLLTFEHIQSLSQVTDLNLDPSLTGGIDSRGSFVDISLSLDLELAFEIPVSPSDPIPLFDLPEEIGIGKNMSLDATASFDPDQPIGNGKGITSFTWYAQRTDQVSSQFLLGTGESLQVSIDEPGVYLVSLQVSDDEGEFASLTKSLFVQVDFLNIVQHGWIPLSSQTQETYREFMQYATDLKSLDRTSIVPPRSTIESAAIDWDARTGFTEAIAFYIGYEVSKLMKRPDLMLAFWVPYKVFHFKAKIQAEIAAQRVADFVAVESGWITDDPNRSYALNLIGHSRGGYVVSKASEILKSKYKIETCFLNLLDGYGDDWPGISNAFADGSILDTSSALHENNHRVEQPLLGIAGDYVAELVPKLFDELPNIPGFPVVPRPAVDAVAATIAWLGENLADWRAPIRNQPNFELNDEVQSKNSNEKSNHVNIHKFYFDDEELLLKSPMGNPRVCVPSNIEPQNDSQILTVDPDSEMNFLSPEWFGRIVEAREIAARNVTSFQESLQSRDDWLGDLLDVVASPGWLENTFFNSDSTTLAHHSSGMGGILLRSNSEIEFAGELSSGDKQLRISIQNPTIVPGTTLVVEFNGVKVGESDLNELTGNELMLSIDPAAEGFGTFQLRLESQIADVPELFVSEIRVIESQALQDFWVQPPFVDGSSRELTLNAFALNAAQAPTFYMETNGLPGLQFGQNGDTSAGMANMSNETWTLSLDSEGLPLGQTVFYAVAGTDFGINQFVQSTIIEKFANRSGLTNFSLPLDVNRDKIVSPLDALLVINRLARGVVAENLDRLPKSHLFDVNADSAIGSIDALIIINYLHRHVTSEGEMAREAVELSSTAYSKIAERVDRAFEDWAIDDNLRRKMNLRRGLF